MNELQPWSGFDRLVDALAAVQAKARDAAARSIDEILTLRNWLIGAWIVAYEQEGADRARYGQGLIDALAAAFKGRGVQGLSGRKFRKYRQIALTWPSLGIRQTASGETRLLSRDLADAVCRIAARRCVRSRPVALAGRGMDGPTAE